MEPLTTMQKVAIKMLMTHGIKPELNPGNPNHYLAVDPGEGSGWATFAENGMPTDFGNVYGDVNGVTDLFETFQTPPKVVIIELFRILKPEDFRMSRLPTLQTVGAVRSYARRVGAMLIGQEPAINNIAENWSNLRPHGAHSKQHFVLAFNHGWYYLQKEKVVVPRVKWPEG